MNFSTCVTFIGAWIAKWSLHSTFKHQCAMPWAMSLCLVDNKLFLNPKSTTSSHIFMISIWLFNLILGYLPVKFVIELWNRKWKILFFKKNLCHYYPEHIHPIQRRVGYIQQLSKPIEWRGFQLLFRQWFLFLRNPSQWHCSGHSQWPPLSWWSKCLKLESK